MSVPGRPAPTRGQDDQGGGPDDGKPEALPDDATVDLASERRDAHVDEVLERLDREMVGLVPVKTRIKEMAALLLVDRLRQRFGLAASSPTLHMSFTGSPGTGKTTVALRMAELLHRLGYLRKGHLVTATRDDLVGQYVGHTAPKTKEVLKRAMGGVLFIDEAYYLYRVDNERDYGQETIEILLQVMEEHRDDIVVILAGYQDRMSQFFTSNPGMRSRIAHHIEFPDYTGDELIQIADLMVADERYRFTDESRAVFRRYLELRMRQPHFANARSVRNAIERARLRQANRIMTSEPTTVSKQDLMTLEPADIRGSRIFADAETDAELIDDETDAELPGDQTDDETDAQTDDAKVDAEAGAGMQSE